MCIRPRIEVAVMSGLSDTEKASAAGSGANADVPRPEGAKASKTQVALEAAMGGGRGLTRCRFFRNMLPEAFPAAVSQPAGRFFLEEDFELAVLKEEMCPYSRQPTLAVSDYGSL
mmetsp:Transcript_22307/g.30445  ORF Transcript_22307/g.30445 Transcript_22307/m.30445 type:complete len:115 (-) Transcript_22307:87-431(-)